MKNLLAVAFLFLSAPLWAAQNQVYPTSAVAQIRDDTYLDSIFSIYLSTPPSWFVIQTYNTDPKLRVDISTTMWHDAMNYALLVIADQTEPYWVWPDTTTFPAPGTWKGWCLSYDKVTQRPVYIKCPQ